MKRTLLILCLSLRLAVAQEPAQKPGDLASLLPGNTLACMEVDDLGGFAKWSRDTALGRVFMEPEMQAFWKNLLKSVDGAIQTGGGPLAMVGLQLSDFEGIEIRRFGLALVDISLEGRKLSVDAVMTLQARKGGDKIEKIVDAVRQGLTNFLGVEFESFDLHGRTVWHTQIQASELYFAAKGDRVFATLTRGRMDQLLQAVDKGNENSLRKAPRYAAIMKRMGADRSALTVYADAKALHAKGTAIARQVVGPRNVDMFDGIWRTLGLDTMDAFAIADVPVGTGFRTEMAITHTGRKGVFKIVAQGRVNHRFARFAPERCLLYGAEHWDAMPSLQAILDLYLAFDNNGQKHVDRFLEDFRKHMGVDLKEDILKSLGADWASFVGSPPGGGLIPDMAIFISLKDRARMEKAMDTIAKHIEGGLREHGTQIEFKEALFRGLRIRFAESPEMPLAPAWAFGDDYLVLALNPQTIKNAHVQKASIAGHAGFRALMRNVPQAASSATWLNTKDIIAWLYNTAVPVLQSVQGMANKKLRRYGAMINFHDLPPVEVITKHLGGTMFYTAPEEGCLRMGYVSPFGSSLVAVGVGVVAAGASVVYMGVEERVAEVRGGLDRDRATAREAAMLRKQLAAQRLAFERRVKQIEQQVAELRRLIEASGK